ncbi:Os05g0293451 [Oryza sativa Japonica Group]|uniref:Os05g0293451 protein n=1 Tax=Oryza sativa subsp. japonica TaxID=39947 RepID=A0A0P0WK96_ORYSJ|nr:Os05g0293451 [Oryza sativa Japonica Group]
MTGSVEASIHPFRGRPGKRWGDVHQGASMGGSGVWERGGGSGEGICCGGGATTRDRRWAAEAGRLGLWRRRGTEVVALGEAAPVWHALVATEERGLAEEQEGEGIGDGGEEGQGLADV